jgi:transcriptional regulator with XRE-family HTH domain
MPAARSPRNTVDERALARQLIRALRGRRSQMALSRRLGHRTNVVYAWESGRRHPSAGVWFKLAQRSGIDCNRALRELLEPALPAGTDLLTRAGVTTLLRTLGAGRTALELARALGVDRTTVGRWLQGTTEPRLFELLKLIALTTQRLFDFVALFADPATLSATRAAYADHAVQQRLAYELPWSHAVLRTLELDAYRALPRHQPGFIAERIGISLAEEQRYLKELLRARQIGRDRGRYVTRRVLTVDTRRRERDNVRIKTHWAEVALQRLRDGSAPADALFSYNLFPIARTELERIRRLHSEYFHRVREIVAESRSGEEIVLLNLQLVPLGRRTP